MTNFEKYKSDLTLDRIARTYPFHCALCPAYPCMEHMRHMPTTMERCTQKIFEWGDKEYNDEF